MNTDVPQESNRKILLGADYIIFQPPSNGPDQTVPKLSFSRIPGPTAPSPFSARWLYDPFRNAARFDPIVVVNASSVDNRKHR